MPFTKFLDAYVSVTGLLIAPRSQYESWDRAGLVDLWVNGALAQEKIEGFLPSWYQFTTAVIEAACPDALNVN